MGPSRPRQVNLVRLSQADVPEPDAPLRASVSSLAEGTGFTAVIDEAFQRGLDHMHPAPRVHRVVVPALPAASGDRPPARSRSARRRPGTGPRPPQSPGRRCRSPDPARRTCAGGLRCVQPPVHEHAEPRLVEPLQPSISIAVLSALVWHGVQSLAENGTSGPFSGSMRRGWLDVEIQEFRPSLMLSPPSRQAVNF